MHQLPLLNPEHVSDEEAARYKTRDSVRIIVSDATGNVALLHATTYGYYKLPGGGVEVGEEFEEALKRECREEIGCEVQVTGEVAAITEYRKQFSLKQTSYCYVGRVVGEKGTPTLEPDEVEHGFVTVWLPLADARAAVAGSDTARVYEAQYMVARDTALLDAALLLQS